MEESLARVATVFVTVTWQLNHSALYLELNAFQMIHLVPMKKPLAIGCRCMVSMLSIIYFHFGGLGFD
jgi:hypothetical protein